MNIYLQHHRSAAGICRWPRDQSRSRLLKRSASAWAGTLRPDAIDEVVAGLV